MFQSAIFDDAVFEGREPKGFVSDDLTLKVHESLVVEGSPVVYVHVCGVGSIISTMDFDEILTTGAYFSQPQGRLPKERPDFDNSTP